ncbi:MAG: hypothetical protein RMJ66_07545, partial [Bacteroidia bacterium]|nr:hypothetical protein [Bacteroidia bacterium]
MGIMSTATRIWLMSVGLFFLLKAQSAWTNWDVYADSTGSGVNPITGFTPLCPDTVWFIVDTTGMGAANIVSYRWNLSNMTGASIVYPSALVGSFPISGVPNVWKLGVKIPSGAVNGAVLLSVQFSGGGSIGMLKPLTTQPAPSVEFLSPGDWQVVCPGAPTNFSLSVVGADSFKVGYGSNPSDTVRNQLNFTATAPSGTNWLVEVFAYYCGGLYSITAMDINLTLPFSPV